MKRKPKPVLLDEEDRQALLESLPVTISSIEVQKKDPQRVSIFAEDAFLFGIPLTAVEATGIGQGSVLDKALFHKLESISIHAGIRSWLLRLLAKRAYTRKQLFRKCREAGFESDVTNVILDEFESRKWLDDQAYAHAYVRDKSGLNRWGPSRIRQQLLLNGVSSRIAEEALKPARESGEQSEAIEHLVIKRKQTFLRETELLKRKKKVVDYLLRKGYDSEIIFRHVDRLLKQIQE